MEKLTRGQRNLAKLRKISDIKVWRGSVTFWNPTQDQKTTATIHGPDASLIAQLHDMLNKEQQNKLYLSIATVSGFHKILDFAWSKASFTPVIRQVTG
jgi:hypothetical protein